jgi:hypothetical protein
MGELATWQLICAVLWVLGAFYHIMGCLSYAVRWYVAILVGCFWFIMVPLSIVGMIRETMKRRRGLHALAMKQRLMREGKWDVEQDIPKGEGWDIALASLLAEGSTTTSQTQDTDFAFDGDFDDGKDG